MACFGTEGGLLWSQSYLSAAYPTSGHSHLGVVHVPSTEGAVPVQLNTGGAEPPGVMVGGRVLPPHLYAIYLQQQQDVAQAQRQQQLSAQEQQQQQRSSSTANELIRRQLEQQGRDLEKRKLERMTWRLADRNLLVLRRGIARVQDLKQEAQECGAGMAIEVNPQLTDIVSSMGLEETLHWLKLTKLPRDVELHDEAWLRNEIAKEKGRSQVQTTPATTASDAASSSAMSTVSTPDASTSAVDTSHDAIPIDLSDSDSDGEQIQEARMADASVQEEEESDYEIIEILE